MQEFILNYIWLLKTTVFSILKMNKTEVWLSEKTEKRLCSLNHAIICICLLLLLLILSTTLLDKIYYPDSIHDPEGISILK